MTHDIDQTVAVEVTHLRAVVRWSRPDKRNAFSREMLEEIDRSLAGLNDNHPQLPIILTGGQYFSAGADAGEMASEPTAYASGLGRLHVAIGDRIAAHQAPVIAAIEGFALGGALVIAASADFVIAASDARLGLTEARVGLVGGLGVVDALAGRLAATRLVLLGDVITAEDALSFGLVTMTVPAGGALAKAEAIAKQLSELNPDAWQHAKRIIRNGAMDRRSAEVEANQSLLLESTYTKERIAEFRR